MMPVRNHWMITWVSIWGPLYVGDIVPSAVTYRVVQQLVLSAVHPFYVHTLCQVQLTNSCRYAWALDR